MKSSSSPGRAIVVCSIWLAFLVSCESGQLGAHDASVVDSGEDDGGDDGGEGCVGGCPTGQICLAGVCVDLCDGVECPAGWHCEAGSCVVDDLCTGVVCTNPGDVCQGGVCVAGEADEDGDGYQARDDCDDNDASVHPGADDICNGINDDCDAATPDGDSDCAGYCCGFPPTCRDACCRADQCGTGSWECTDYACSCDGLNCGGTCHGDGECCDDEDCGGELRCDTDRSCVCDGVTCDGSCSASGECCVDEDCGDGAWSCTDHNCVCAGESCGDGYCADGTAACCSASTCGAGDYECLDHACSCSGAVCAGVCDATISSCCRGPVGASESSSSSSGEVCDLSGVMAEGGTVTGLSNGASGVVEIDGMNITACVELDFGEVIESGSIRVVARYSGGPVCGNSCTTECGTGHTGRLFAGVGGGTYSSVSTIDLGSSLSSTTYPIGFSFSHALVCRAGWGYNRDHVEVDYVEACITSE